MKNLLVAMSAIILLSSTSLKAERWKHETRDLGKRSGILHSLEFETPHTVNCGPSDFKGEPQKSIGSITFLCLEPPSGESPSEDPLGVQVGVTYCGTPYTLDVEEPFSVYINGKQYPNGDSISIGYIHSMTANPLSAFAFHRRLIENDGEVLVELERLRQPTFTVGARFVFEEDASGTFTSGLDEAFELMPPHCKP